MNQEELVELITKLKKASMDASVKGNYALSVELANASERYIVWQENGMKPGDEPETDLSSLLGDQYIPLDDQSMTTDPTDKEEIVEDIVDTVEIQENISKPLSDDIETTVEAKDIPLPDAPIEPITPAEPPMEKAFLEMYEAAKLEAEDWKQFTAVLKKLEEVQKGTKSPTLKKMAEDLLISTRELRVNRIEELISKAKSLPRGDEALEDQEKAWKNVLLIDSNNPEALASLDEVRENKRIFDWKKKIARLRNPLLNPQKDIRDVENVRNEASQYIAGGEIPTPGLKKEATEVFNLLDNLRNEIITASKGAVSSQRQGNYEYAIEKFTTALNKNLIYIPDDLTGDPVNVIDKLREIRLEYWSDLSSRSQDRLKDADSSMELGYPETSVSKLEEAYDLIRKIEEGGDEIRAKIELRLTQAREERDAKLTAQTLLNDAETASDPELALSFSLQAEVLYPKFPDIKSKIADRHDLAVNKIVRDMNSDLALAQGAMAVALSSDDLKSSQENFERARSFCNAASQRGANLKVTNALREECQAKVVQLFKAIEEAESPHYHFLNQLIACDKALKDKDANAAIELLDGLKLYGDDTRVTSRQRSLRRLQILERLRLIDQAIFLKDEPLARNNLDDLLSGLSKEEKMDAEVLDRQARITGLKNDVAQFNDAWEFFMDQLYDPVISTCKNLIRESVNFRDKAQKLLDRAQGRKSIQVARQERFGGSIESLERSVNAYRSILAESENLLPEEKALIQSSESELALVSGELDLARQKQTELENIRTLRNSKSPQWKEWVERIRNLRQNVPDWMRAEIVFEYQTGTSVWIQQVHDQIKKIKDDQISKAYPIMKELVDYEIITTQDEEWSQWSAIEYNYYRFMAQQALSSLDYNDWSKAEEFAFQSRNRAPEDKMYESQEFFLQTSREVILKRANYLALEANTGPQQAINLLEEKMNQHQILKSDAKMQAYLVWFHLSQKNYSKAFEQARTFAYVNGEEKHVMLWCQLVEATRDFELGLPILLGDESVDQKLLLKSTNALLEIKKRIYQDVSLSETIIEFFNKIWDLLLKQLHDVITNTSTTSNTAEFINHIQALDLLFQFEPDDQKTEGELKTLMSQLESMFTLKKKEVDNLTLLPSLDKSIRNGRKLLSEMIAIHRTFIRFNNKFAAISSGEVKRIDDQLNNWLEAEKLLFSIEQPADQSVNRSINLQMEFESEASFEESSEVWLKTISSTWDMTELNQIINDLQELRVEDTNEFKQWSQKICDLRPAMDSNLKEIWKSVKTCWHKEDFPKLLEVTKELKRQLLEVAANISDNRISVPKGFFKDFVDPYLEPHNFTTLDITIEKAENKYRNLDLWRQWETKHKEIQKNNDILYSSTISNMEEYIPPKLTAAKLESGLLLAEYTKLMDHLKDQPEIAISNSAKKLRDYYGLYYQENVAKLLPIYLEKISQIDDLLVPVDNLAGKIQAFPRTRPLSTQSNRDKLTAMLFDLYNLDASHPYIKQYGCNLLIKIYKYHINWLPSGFC